MKLFTMAILLLSLSLFLPQAAHASKRFSIKSEPSGATVDIGRLGPQMEGAKVIGTTPILSELDDYWFNGPNNAETRYLSEPIIMNVSKEGYETKTQIITKGPFEWVSSDGTQKKRYYIMTSTDFYIKLEPALNTPSLSGPPQPAFTPPANATWYKRAPDEINRKAKSKLEHALSVKAADTMADDIFAKAVVCGPLLWELLKDQAGRELKESVPINFIMRIPRPVTKEGRNFIKSEQKQSFWNYFMEQVKGSSSVAVRRASKPEIDYYWSTISFDIEEPLYVVDIGERKVIFNFMVDNGEPRIFWMDVVGNPAGGTNK
jgi:hypothetical protein